MHAYTQLCVHMVEPHAHILDDSHASLKITFLEISSFKDIKTEIKQAC